MFVVILHVYGALVIFILFYDDQDTESGSREMKIGVSGQIFTQKNVKVSLGKPYPYPKIWDKSIVVIIHLHGARAMFYYFMVTKTPNLSHLKYKLVYLDQYPPRKYQRIYGCYTRWEQNIMANIHIH